MTLIEQGVLRTATALSILGAPPTVPELVQHYDRSQEEQQPSFYELEQALSELVRTQVLGTARGRYFPVSMTEGLGETFLGEEWLPRKLRKVKKIARWLARLSGVRAVFLCNRTAFGLPHDEGDLDFLVIMRHGSIWQTRGLAGAPFVLLGDRPRPGEAERDVVCLSFFLSDQALDLSSCALQPDDMYLRHWFLGLLPFVDDGVGEVFWQANQILRRRHPHAKQWILSPDLQVPVPRLRLPVSHALERVARTLQWKYFPRALRDKANLDTRVMISDTHLKFHVDDGREELQATYQSLCDRYGITS